MYNVIIVDDEPVIRFGLKASINWEEEGLTLLGDFSNGAEALKEIESNQVDILITDIKMPIIDGITLMKKSLEQAPNLKVVLVSSYNDFEYVKEGLTYGAVDYVLKHTLEPDEFLQVIKKCVSKLNEEKEIDEKIKLIDQSNLLQERKKIEQQLKQALLHSRETSKNEEKEKQMSGPYIFVYMKMNNVEKVEEEYGFLYKNLIIEDIQESFYSKLKKGICFPLREADLLFLLENEPDPEIAIQKIRENVLNETEISFSFGYDMISDLSEAVQGLQKSKEACERYFFHPGEFIFPYKKQERGLYIRSLKAEHFKQYLLPFDEKKVTELVEERYKYWKQEEIRPDDIINEASMLLTNLFFNKIDFSLLLEKSVIIKKSETLDELFTMLLNQIKDCVQLISEQNNKPYIDNDLLENVLDYIHQHYTEELTLQMVADHIHISRNYFSILFKKFTDKKFIDYVIELRINKATELLMNTSLKVYEVAEKSGFNDVKYFSKLFKKMTGYSPVDYRTIYKK